jgi:hypothetical protein
VRRQREGTAGYLSAFNEVEEHASAAVRGEQRACRLELNHGLPRFTVKTKTDDGMN